MKSEYEIIEYGSFARVYPNTHENRIFVFMGFQWAEIDATLCMDVSNVSFKAGTPLAIMCISHPHHCSRLRMMMNGSPDFGN